MTTRTKTARIRSVMMNSGKYSLEEADEKINNSSLSIFLGEDVAGTPAGQAAFLTAVAEGVRSFGQVHVSGDIEQLIITGTPFPVWTLKQAAELVGASTLSLPGASKWVVIGSGCDVNATWAINTYWHGWVAGVSPKDNKIQIGRSDCTLAGIAAGAMAVGQAFLAEQGDLRAGTSNQSISIWSPQEDAADADNPFMENVRLPKSLWLIGLGNLGQAYLWVLFMLPYATPGEVELFFQDDDPVDIENWGTSVLVELGRYGDLKTLIAEEWSRRRGFQVRRLDRRIDENFRRTNQEPSIALAGLDKMPVRKVLGQVGFDCIVDCGLGATSADYTKFRINVFDRDTDPANHFKGVEDKTEEMVKAHMELQAYKDLAAQMNDGACGAATLAGKSTAVPFVSGVVGALAIGQIIRLVSNALTCTSIVGNVNDLRSVRASLSIPGEKVYFPSTGPEQTVSSRMMYLPENATE
jgi:hypothetical protein